MFSKLSTLTLALATTSLALPSKLLPRASNDGYAISVLHFTSTCTAATCYYNFNATANVGPSYANPEPHFVATDCSGNSFQEPAYAACGSTVDDSHYSVSNPVLSVMEENHTDAGSGLIGVFLRLVFQKDTGNGLNTYTYVGNTTLENPQEHAISGFVVYPTLESVVAA